MRRRSLYEVIHDLRHGATWRDAAGGLWRPPQATGHDSAIYQYSVPPWQWFECLWPSINGRWEESNSRWTAGIPAEGRVWSPSLYFGLAPVLLAFSAARWRRPAPGDPPASEWTGLRWRLTWTAALAVAASLGVYGVGFLVNEVMFSVGARASPLGPQVSGVYWALTWLAPDYAWFRYPAKWLPLATWAITLLAAIQLQRGGEQSAQRTILVPQVIFLASITLLIAMLACRFGPALLVQMAKADAADYVVFGPLDRQRALWRILRALGHTSCVCLALWLVARRTRGLAWVRGVVLLTAVDLSVALAGLLPTTADEVVAEPVEVARPDGKHAPGDPFAVDSRSDAFQFSGGAAGKDAWLLAERQVLLGRHHLRSRESIRLLDSIQSLAPASWSTWQAALARRPESERRRLRTFGLRSAAPRPQWFGRTRRLTPLASDARLEERISRAFEVQGSTAEERRRVGGRRDPESAAAGTASGGNPAAGNAVAGNAVAGNAGGPGAGI